MKLSTPVVLLAWSSVLASSVLAQTQIGGGTCNSSTLNGTYQLILGGRQVTSTGSVSKVFQATGTAAFDGQSKVALTMTANIVSTTQAFGTPLVYSGTYSLQSNCLGTVTITGGDTATFTLESYNQGSSYAIFGSDATYAYNGSGNIQPGTCPSTLSGGHEFNANGNTLSGTSVTGTLDVAGILSFDPQGNLTANWTQASNTVTTTVSAGSVNSPTATAKAGDVVVAYFTGGGPVNAAGKLATGAPSPNGLSPVTGTSSVTVNGVAATAAYVGLTPGGIGLYQANFTIPKVAAGNHPLVITIAGQPSNRPLISIGN